MDHVVTSGDVLATLLVIGGIVAIIGFLIWLLAASASGFDH